MLTKNPTKKKVRPGDKSPYNNFEAYTPLSFTRVNRQAKIFADLIEENVDSLIDILLVYESFEVAEDEIARTLDLLRNLKENRKYFKVRVGKIASFLPRNQPLYAFTCFVVIPALMSESVVFRIPHTMHEFFPKLLDLLSVKKIFPNIIISKKTRLEFLRECSAIKVNSKSGETLPVTDAVIFTGTSDHADRLRLIFDQRTLMIVNGSGHNPVVVSANANLEKAADAVLTLQLYNQGQDCAAPNAILVNKDISASFLKILQKKLKDVKIGPYRNKINRVGPISEPNDLVRIQNLLVEHKKELDPSTPGIIRTRESIVEPVIIRWPLAKGGNFHEVFAPVIILQEYKEDKDLARYFEDPHYARNAMYVTIYGTSVYIKKLANRRIAGVVLHDSKSILKNTHLHAPGVERGTQPYGGRGYAASCLSIHGTVMPQATLPQRDIYKYVAQPLLDKKARNVRLQKIRMCDRIEEKNVEKLLRLFKEQGDAHLLSTDQTSVSYIDVRAFSKSNKKSYIALSDSATYTLLERPNIAYATKLTSHDIKMIESLLKLLHRRSKITPDIFRKELYAIPVDEERNKKNRARQRLFFQHIYQLLFGMSNGPQLAQFLYEVDLEHITGLLDT